MGKLKISRTAARAVLAELQSIADDRARLLGKGQSFTDSDFARFVVSSLIGSLEARLPLPEWNKVDIFRVWRAL